MAEEHVIGTWKDFTFEMATPSHHAEISKHVSDYFLRSEAMNVYLGWEEQNAKGHAAMIAISLPHGCSFLVRHTASGELVGFQEVLDSRLPGYETLPEITSINLKKLFGFMAKSSSATEDAFKRAFKCDFYAKVAISSVTTKYRRQGLATEIYARMIKFLRAKGFPALRTGFTSPGTRAIGSKFGFVELGRFYFKDVVDESGQKVFPSAGDGEEEFMTSVACAL